jgi:serine/threonine protein kinase
VIAGRYQPLESVRPGAPFKARDASTAQTVVIHTAPGASVFHRGCLVAGISHPSLITMFDVFRDEAGATCVAVEWVESKPARQVMAGVPFNARRAGAIAAEIADAVAELHASGVAHGAISVDSVRLTAKGKAKLDLTSAVSVEGACVAADVAALGALLRELGGPALGVPGDSSAAVVAAQCRALVSSP